MEVWLLREPHNSSELLTDVKWLETLFPENKTHSPPHSFSLFTENPPMTYLCENKSNYHNHHSHKAHFSQPSAIMASGFLET